MPPNTLTLARVHAILDDMAGDATETNKELSNRKVYSIAVEDDIDANVFKQSSTIQNAMRLTADLWPRQSAQWPEDEIDAKSSSLTSLVLPCRPERRKVTSLAWPGLTVRRDGGGLSSHSSD